jgi:hypothetical protein
MVRGIVTAAIKTLSLRRAADHMRNRQILVTKNTPQSACGLVDATNPRLLLRFDFGLEFSSALE